MSINELFGNNETELTTGTRTLSGTAALTNLSASVATDIIKTMDASIDEYRERIAESSNDGAALDELIKELGNLKAREDDWAFIKEIDEATIDNMLKSQQSKRSRSKSKAMTVDNYRTLMTAAIAEAIIRLAIGKPKTSGGFKHTGSVDFTPADLEALAEDQQRLRKEIRNIQSKKSIMKSKEGFDAGSEAWQQLLKVEAMLKDLRVGATTTTIEVDTTKNALTELLDGVELEHLKAADSKELLTKISEMLK